MKRRNVRFNPHSGKYVWTEFLDYEKKVHVVSGARRGFTFNENTYTEIRKVIYCFLSFLIAYTLCDIIKIIDMN